MSPCNRRPEIIHRFNQGQDCLWMHILLFPNCSHQSPLSPFGFLFSLLCVPDLFKNLAGVTQQVVSFFLVAHNVNQFEVFPGEEQAVEVVQVDICALVVLESVQESGND